MTERIHKVTWLRMFSGVPGCATVAALALLLTACPGGEFYEGAPDSPEFPRPPGYLEGLIARTDTHGLRRHSWHIFSAITQPSRYDPSIPRLETWYDIDTAFDPHPGTRILTAPARRLERDGEFTPEHAERLKFDPPAIVLYNREAYRHIRENLLYDSRAYACLIDNGKFDVPDFPERSIVLKLDWLRVSRSEPSHLGIWDRERPAPGLSTMGHSNWRRQACIAADTRQCTDPAEIKRQVTDLYHIEVKPEELKKLREMKTPDSEKYQVNDFMVLIALHFTTREQKNWVWSTFWWHPEPTFGPFAEDRPAHLTGPWGNYLMETAYDMDRPREPDASPRIAQNPYLEGQMTDGAASNCMTCHRRATWWKGRDNPVSVLNFDGSSSTVDGRGLASVVVRGSDAATETYFDKPFDERLKLSFLWTLRRGANQQIRSDQPTFDCDQFLKRIAAQNR